VLPAGPEKIKETIRSEVSRYMLFAGSDILTDFCPLKEVAEEGIKKIRILAAAAKKEVVESYIEVIKLAGLNLRAINAGSLAIAGAVLDREPVSENAAVLVVVEDSKAVIFIFKDGEVNYLYDVDSIKELEQGVESAVAYCESEFGKDCPIKKIISTDIEGISIAGGLILKGAKKGCFKGGINLLPLEEIKIKEFDNNILFFLKSLGILVSALIIWLVLIRFQTWLTFRNIADIQDTLNKPSLVLNELLDVESMSKRYDLELKNQQNIILKAKTKKWAQALEEIKKIIPKKAFLLSIKSGNEGQVTFNGEAVDTSTVFDFVQSLKGSKYFENIKLEKSEDKEEEQAHIYFVIKCRLR
ncbi:MAG: PilN domain-containing protein, partial [Candidatus Omnitrophota bacterium]